MIRWYYPSRLEKDQIFILRFSSLFPPLLRGSQVRHHGQAGNRRLPLPRSVNKNKAYGWKSNHLTSSMFHPWRTHFQGNGPLITDQALIITVTNNSNRQLNNLLNRRSKSWLASRVWIQAPSPERNGSSIDDTRAADPVVRRQRSIACDPSRVQLQPWRCFLRDHERISGTGMRWYMAV